MEFHTKEITNKILFKNYAFFHEVIKMLCAYSLLLLLLLYYIHPNKMFIFNFVCEQNKNKQQLFSVFSFNFLKKDKWN